MVNPIQTMLTLLFIELQYNLFKISMKYCEITLHVKYVVR